jgi:hypothetical protein
VRTLLVLLLLSAALAPALPDFTNIKLEEHGVPPVVPKKDPKTGFLVGGKNATDLVRGLKEINGLSVARLEKIMRPEALSRAGFLGKDEKLTEVMAADNRYVVEERGLTHQELARHLHALGAAGRLLAVKDKVPAATPGPPFRYHGRTYRVAVTISRGFQESPFDDDTRSRTNVAVKNVDNGKELKYSLLVPFMVERYGFYEGRGTPYRVEPRKVLEVLDFLAKK